MENRQLLDTIGEHFDLLQPFGNYITIEIFQSEAMTKGGIVLPEQSRDKQCLARVISVGPGQRSLTTGEYLPPKTRPGDLIVIRKFAPEPIKIGGKECHVIAEGDIIGKIDEEQLNALLAAQESATTEA